MYRAFKKIVSFILAASICTTGGVFSTVCAEDEVTTDANAAVKQIQQMMKQTVSFRGT